jgi:nitroreductase
MIKGRFSTRNYLKKDVPEDKLNAVLNAARFAQSARNLQDWKFVVVRDPAIRGRLAVAAKDQMFVSEAPVVIACCGVGVDYIMTCGQYAYALDVAIAMENMALAAHEVGLGTCWLGAFYEDEVKKELGIPRIGVRVVGLLTLGYPGVTAPEKKRKDVEEIVSYDRWS